MIRILIVEDDQRRVDWFRAWLPRDIRLIHARSGGKALGILERDADELAGIMLDHDLQESSVVANDKNLSGSTVIIKVMQHIRPNIPIMVHCMNPGTAERMKKALEASGSSVTRMPMGEMSKDAFLEWLEEVREEVEG